MHPMTTMPHSRQVLLRCAGVFLKLKGLSLWKYMMMTARIAPIWMTTRNRARNWSDTCSFTNSSMRIICPVDEMGSHSVMPSTMPSSRAFRISIIMYELSCVRDALFFALG